MRIAGEYTAVYGVGAVIYSLMEILWRGFTHWTMSMTGGLCLSLIYVCEGRLSGRSMWKKCSVGCVIITAAEFIVGCLVNLALGWRVWDYSDRPANLLGQICPTYCAIWFALSVPAFALCKFIKTRIFGKAASVKPDIIDKRLLSRR